MKRILVVRFRAIGDCVMAAWPVTALRNAFPDAEIVWATEPMGVPVIDRQRLAQQVIEFPRDRWKKQGARSWGEQLRTYLGLRKQEFDLGIDFQGHLKTALALRLAKPRQRLSVAATDAMAARLNPVFSDYGDLTHVVERHLKAVGSLVPISAPERPIMPEDLPAVEVLPSGPYVSLMTGASSMAKLVPIETWQAVAASLLRQGVGVVAVGGPNDSALGVAGTVDLVGKTSLRQTMSILRGSAAHVAADTGTGHLAAAYGVPGVSVFGRGKHGPDRFRPYSQTIRVLQEDRAADVTSEAISGALLHILGKSL